MKCENCGAEVAKGELICPACQAEIHWVPDYNTIDYMMEEKKRKQTRENEQSLAKRTSISHITFILKGILILGTSVALSVAIIYAVRFRQRNSYTFQKRMAISCFESKNEQRAMLYVNRALAQNPSSIDMPLLKAKLLVKSGERQEAISLLEDFIKDQKRSQECYRFLISLYEKNKDGDAVSRLLLDLDEQGLNEEFDAYLPAKVSFSLPSGTYEAGTRVTLTAKEGYTIYYTLNHQTPDQNSIHYHEPLVLTESDTQICAIAVSPKGIIGDAVKVSYQLRNPNPSSPAILPASGTYTAGSQKISITVPEGHKAYYTFDGTPTKAYTSPVEMPMGTHIFSAVLVDEAGRQSRTESRTYSVVEES